VNLVFYAPRQIFILAREHIHGLCLILFKSYVYNYLFLNDI